MIKILTKLGKIMGVAVIVMSLVMAGYLLQASEGDRFPSWLFVSFFLSLVLALTVALVSGVTECVLVCREKGKKGLKPVLYSFLLYACILVLYVFFTSASPKEYLWAVGFSVIITLCSCTYNLWKRAKTSVSS